MNFKTLDYEEPNFCFHDQSQVNIEILFYEVLFWPLLSLSCIRKIHIEFLLSDFSHFI